MTNEFLKGKRVVLASNSPRRKELMQLLCENFEVLPSDVDETVPEDVAAGFTDTAIDMPEFLAKLKAEDVAKKAPDAVVIGCDTVVSIDDIILGKPASHDDAKRMLELLSGRTHRVVSGVCIIYRGKTAEFACETKVRFRQLSHREIEEYIAGGEAYDKAGAYGIQGDGALFSTGIDGDFFNVVGFPVSEINLRLLSFQEK